MESALIAKALPGLGNPFLIPIDDYYGYLDRLTDIKDAESGAHDHRSFVEREARRQTRRGW